LLDPCANERNALTSKIKTEISVTKSAHHRAQTARLLFIFLPHFKQIIESIIYTRATGTGPLFFQITGSTPHPALAPSQGERIKAVRQEVRPGKGGSPNRPQAIELNRPYLAP
jgi:hypothetical protein